MIHPKLPDTCTRHLTEQLDRLNDRAFTLRLIAEADIANTDTPQELGKYLVDIHADLERIELLIDGASLLIDCYRAGRLHRDITR